MTDQPADLRDQIAEALMSWAERNANPQYAALRRPETVRRNAYGRADAVLAVLDAAGVRDAARQANGQQPDDCTCITPPEEDAGQLLHGIYCVSTGAHVCPAGEPCPVCATLAVGVQDATQPTTDETEQAARDDLYDALDQSWYRWDPPSMTKGAGIIRLIDAYRAEVLREAADFIDKRQAQMDEEIRAEYGELDRDTEVEGTATRRMASELRRLAAGAES